MECCDGIVWRAADNKIYVADMLAQRRAGGGHGRLGRDPAPNGDTDGADGSLDQPCEVLVDGDRLVVINMDWWWDCEWLTNKKIDQPFTVSVIALFARDSQHGFEAGAPMKKGVDGSFETDTDRK